MKMKVLAFVILIILASQVKAVILQQGYNSYSGTIDTYISYDNQTTDYSNANYMEVGNKNYGLIKFQNIFDDIHVSSSSEITATLSVYVYDTGTCGAKIFRVLNDWSETDTYSTYGDDMEELIMHARDDEKVNGGSSEGWLTFNVTECVRSWYNITNPNYGFALSHYNSSETDSWLSYSSKYLSDSSLRPKLIITPEPATILMFGLGVLALRRKTRV